jgi:molybdenum cofactor biosynthesis enzyme
VVGRTGVEMEALRALRALNAALITRYHMMAYEAPPAAPPD